MDNSAATLPNEALLVAQSAVDASAFAAVYDHYFARIYNYIRYRVQDADTTDDITAQVFERALANINSYRPDKAPFAAWLFAIARNAINDHLRLRQRRRWLSLDILRHQAGAQPEPGEIVGDAETKEALLKAVSHLADRERDLIGLKFAGGLTNRRIAELTGLSESNVGIILYRTIRRLRKELNALGVQQ